MSVRTAALDLSSTPALPPLPSLTGFSLPIPGFKREPQPVAEALPVANPIIRAMLGGGFAKGEVAEILTMSDASGELSLVLPAVASLKRAFWVLPSVEFFTPSAPAMEDAGLDLTQQLFVTPSTTEEAYWAVERAVAEGRFGAVVAWLKPLAPAEDRRAMRRIALAARTSGTTVFVVRPLNLCGTATSANVRVALSPVENGETRVSVTHAGGLISRTTTAVTHLTPVAAQETLKAYKAFENVRPFRPAHVPFHHAA